MYKVFVKYFFLFKIIILKWIAQAYNWLISYNYVQKKDGHNLNSII